MYHEPGLRFTFPNGVEGMLEVRPAEGIHEDGCRSAPTALIVDDQPFLVQALAERLSMDGFETTVVGTAAEALEECTHRDYDVVFLDYRLPDSTGDLVAAAIKRQSRNARIVLMTGMLSALEGLGAGIRVDHVDALLPKPWKSTEYQKVLDSVRGSQR